MISAQDLLSEHTSHLVLYRLLETAIAESTADMEYCKENEDSVIEALSLSQLPLDGMPHLHSRSSPTERIATQVLNLKSGQAIRIKERQLRTVRHYLQLYDTIMELFTEREKWFIDQYYNHKYSLSALIEKSDSPFYGYDRSSVWRFKKRLLTKAEAALSIVYEQKGYGSDR